VEIVGPQVLQVNGGELMVASYAMLVVCIIYGMEEIGQKDYGYN
jgi:hypothetical protein